MSQFRTFLIISSLLLPATVRAQFAASAERVAVSTVLSHTGVEPGSVIEAAVIIDIEKSWHVNANVPTYDYLIGTALEFSPENRVIVADIRYPTGELQKLAFADQPLSVYDGRTVVFVTLRVSDRSQPGIDTVRGVLRLQACDDHVCLAPSSIPFAMTLPVVTQATPVSPTHGDVFALATTEAYERSVGNDGDLAAMLETEGSLVAFLAIFLIGLALNLTPCVYPMMSVTVSLFGGSAGTGSEQPFSVAVLRAMVYVFGIVTMYTTLGVFAALSGGLFGSWLQSPWVLGGIGLLLFGMALSSFGLYQLTVPYWLTSRLGGQQGTGLLTLYLSGLFVGVFAAPCIGPPVIALLALVGSKADPVFGFQAFFSLSLGLGAPYLVLGTFSGLLKRIPRSGPWLVWVERLFGVVLTGAALFYLGLAFIPAYAVSVVPLTLILGGVYLGFLDRSGRTSKALQYVQRGVGVVSIAWGALMAQGLTTEGVAWEPYSAQAVAEATTQGKPVLLDFYADWCIPCIELDRDTFTDPEVIRRSAGMVRLKVDLTHFDSPEAESIRQQYRISGVPTIVFLRGDGTEERSARVVGFVTAEEFIKRLGNLERTE